MGLVCELHAPTHRLLFGINNLDDFPFQKVT